MTGLDEYCLQTQATRRARYRSRSCWLCDNCTVTLSCQLGLMVDVGRHASATHRSPAATQPKDTAMDRAGELLPWCSSSRFCTSTTLHLPHLLPRLHRRLQLPHQCVHRPGGLGVDQHGAAGEGTGQRGCGRLLCMRCTGRRVSQPTPVPVACCTCMGYLRMQCSALTTCCRLPPCPHHCQPRVRRMSHKLLIVHSHKLLILYSHKLPIVHSDLDCVLTASTLKAHLVGGHLAVAQQRHHSPDAVGLHVRHPLVHCVRQYGCTTISAAAAAVQHKESL